jgi:hypothetical protein
MSRPTTSQVAAAAAILARDWDVDGDKAGGLAEAYLEWGAGIGDMIIHDPPDGTLVEYLAVLEEQLGLPPSARAERERWASQLVDAVRGAAV